MRIASFMSSCPTIAEKGKTKTHSKPDTDALDCAM
jgi:hypothetical protein